MLVNRDSGRGRSHGNCANGRSMPVIPDSVSTLRVVNDDL